MELGNRIRGRYLATGRRKGIIAPSELLTRYIPGRYGRRFLALRPLALAHLKQAGKKGEGQGAVHLHPHFHFPWQASIAQHFSGIYQTAISERIETSFPRLLISPASSTGTNANSGKPSFRRTPESSQANRMIQIPAIRINAFGMSESRPLVARSLTHRILTSAGMTNAKPSPTGLASIRSAGQGNRVEKIDSKHPASPSRLSMIIHSPTSSNRASATVITGGRGDGMPSTGRERVVVTDIRILSPRAASIADASAYGDASVSTRGVAPQATTESFSSVIRSRNSLEAVRMVVKHELSNREANAAAGQEASKSVAQQITAAAPAVAAAAVQAIQPKIDVNRLTDEVYRMLERRLVTERERRGR